jgi:hypothetical protein
MRRIIKFFSYLSLLFATVFLTSCVNNNSIKTAEYGEATIELMEIVEDNPNLRSMLIASIEKAKEINPDRNTNPAQNLEEYYEFVSRAETSMPWALLKKSEYPEIFDNTFQSLCYFYFLIDQPLSSTPGPLLPG